MKKRILSIMIVFALCLDMMPSKVAALTQNDTTTCSHHPIHTEDCGYVEEIEGAPCTHEHTEECYKQVTQCVHEHVDACYTDVLEDGSSDPDAEQTLEPDENMTGECSHICSVESGCIVEALDCQHEHDSECGYVEAVPGHPCGYVCEICSSLEQAEEEQADAEQAGVSHDESGEFDVPYYLFIIHSLKVSGGQYGSTELVELSKNDFADDTYDLHRHAFDKEGMQIVKASYLDKETYDLTESWTVSLSDFAEAGDPADGSNYYAVQVLIEYGVAEGYQAVVPDNPAPADDPYGIMPLAGFTGSDILEIIFKSVSIATITVQYLYSPTGGLSGMSAAASVQYQVLLDSEADIAEHWEIPYADENGNYQNLDGFRIVLDPSPLNQFLIDPVLADEMTANPDPQKVQAALENDLFSIDPAKGVYREGGAGGVYNNIYSDTYNEAWNTARTITPANGFYTATAASAGSTAPTEGAGALTAPMLNVTIPKGKVSEIIKKLEEINDEENADKKTRLQKELDDALTVTVYYRRNAGSYTVAHWVCDLPSGVDYPVTQERDGKTYYKVYEEIKQGRVGAMTNAVSKMGVMEPEDGKPGFDFTPYVTEGFGQQIIKSNNETTIDIFYQPASEYRIIFNTDDTYIPRVQADLNNTLEFDYSGNGSLRIGADGTFIEEGTYQNPLRVGYQFAGWRYEVKSGLVSEAYQEDGKYYVDIKSENNNRAEFRLEEGNIANIVRANDDPTVNAIYLYPLWEPGEASVRVVFWTEDLSGGTSDAKVEITNSNGAYEKRVQDYEKGTPEQVGESFSNLGSFTFTAGTEQVLLLQVNEKKLESAAGGGEAEQFTVLDAGLPSGQKTGTLAEIIGAMFEVRMPKVQAFDGTQIPSCQFYYPYAINKAEHAKITVSADGSAVINVYYARNVYSIDFTYYGEIEGKTSISYQTNGYSLLNNPKNYTDDIDLETNDSDGVRLKKEEDKEWFSNKWQAVTEGSSWEVPEKVTILAKYDADIGEIWPYSNGETVGIEQISDFRSATFISWAATAGPYNATYKNAYAANGSAQGIEPTIMSIYDSMSADIIADPEDPEKTHHMYAYWWYSYISYYRYNHCYEVPDLTLEELLGTDGVNNYDLTDLEFGNRDHAHELEGVTEEEKERCNTVYLVPVNNSSLKEYFEDYKDALARVDEQGGENSGGGYYALRSYEGKVYALAQSVIAPSTDVITRQNPSAQINLTRANNTADHDTRAGGLVNGSEVDGNGVKEENIIGTIEKPYDLFFYYNRNRFTITYMVPAKDSSSGEYTLGTREMPFGASLSRYQVVLENENNKIRNLYSNDKMFQEFWNASKNNQALTAGSDSINPDGYARMVPDSAVDGTGIWAFGGWALDRALTERMDDADWMGTVSGNLRIFADWIPPTYKVTFDLAGGVAAGSNGSGSSADVVYTNMKANQGFTSSGNPIPRPLRNGYILAGWDWYPDGEAQTEENKLTDFTFDTPVTRDMVAVASWTTFQAKEYSYKIWYLTDDPDAQRRTGDGWIPESESGSPGRDTALPSGLNRSSYTYVLGCEYFEKQKYPEGTGLLLGTKSFAGYIPYNGNATIELTDENLNETAKNTRYVAYFYYNKVQTKKYAIQFQPVKLINGANDGPVLEGITQEGETDKAYFSPTDESFQALKGAGYQLVQMNADGTVVMEDGKPKAAYSVEDLKAFIDAENRKYANLDYNQTMEITFKVMPITYNICYKLGNLVENGGSVDSKGNPEGTLQEAMQDVLDALKNEENRGVVSGTAFQNPTTYNVSDFKGNFSFTLKNPVYIQDPEDGEKWWKFTGWSTGEETQAVSTTRSGDGGEYPTLTVDYAVGNLTFLANWERIDAGIAEVEINFEKKIDGRSFQAGDSFTFTLTGKGDAPAPKDQNWADVKKATITPSSGNRVDISFGRFLFEKAGVYVYTVEEQPGNAKGMTYDTAPRKLTITVTEEDGKLKASADTSDVEWINTYQETGPDEKNDKDPSKSPDSNENSGADSGAGSGTEGGRLPQTGMLWRPVWLLAVAGIIMLVLGIARKKR